jgi:hypothetical protein
MDLLVAHRSRLAVARLTRQRDDGDVAGVPRRLLVGRGPIRDEPVLELGGGDPQCARVLAFELFE